MVVHDAVGHVGHVPGFWRGAPGCGEGPLWRRAADLLSVATLPARPSRTFPHLG